MDFNKKINDNLLTLANEVFKSCDANLNKIGESLGMELKHHKECEKLINEQDECCKRIEDSLKTSERLLECLNKTAEKFEKPYYIKSEDVSKSDHEYLHRKNKEVKHEDREKAIKMLEASLNNCSYVQYKYAANKMAALYLEIIAEECDADIQDAIQVVANKLHEAAYDKDEVRRIVLMETYLKHFIKCCECYNEGFMPMHYTIAKKAKEVLEPSYFYNDRNYELRLESLYNMARGLLVLQ